MNRAHESSTLVFDEENVYLLLRFRMPLIGFLVQSIRLGCELSLIDPAEAKQGPPAVIKVYTGGSIRWSDVKVPTGVTEIDKRKNRSSSSDSLSRNGKKRTGNFKSLLIARLLNFSSPLMPRYRFS